MYIYLYLYVEQIYKGTKLVSTHLSGIYAYRIFFIYIQKSISIFIYI